MPKKIIYAEDAIDALGEKPLVWDDLSDFDLGKAAQWSDDVDAIKELPSAQPQWIPVLERLPEEDTEVLTYDSSFGITFDSLHRGKWRKHPDAWMPLPEPYKGEQG